MKVRRLIDLAQVPDPDFLAALGEGASHSLKNAEHLFAEASAAHRAGARRGYLILRGAASEEAAKVLILLDAARCPKSESKSRSRQLFKFTEHLARMIYSEVAGLSPTDFRELERLVAVLREEYYLDGPSEYPESNWVYRNRLLQEREGTMYVDFVETEAGRRWEVPNENLAELLVQCEPIEPASLRMARHLGEVGLLTAAGVKAVAETWRGMVPTSGMPWATFRQLNQDTLKRLDAAALLRAGGSSAYSAVSDEWPFPMWSLDMKLLEVRFEDMQVARTELASKYPEGDY